MAINPNNGVLDIINGTLKVSSIDIKQAAGFTTALNTVARNDVLLFDDQKASTVFTPTSEGGYMSSTGVTRDTTGGAGYIDLNDGWVYWPLQLPNSWHTEFDMHVTTTGGVLTFSLFNTSEPNHTDYTNNDGGYKIVFDNTNNQIDIYWEGSIHKTVGANLRSSDWQHVNINYFQGAVSVSLAGKVVLTHEFTQNYQEFNSRYVGFSATTGASHKIRHLIVHNSDKWLYTKTSNASDITYVSGNVGIGSLSPTELLDVHGNVHIARDLTVDGNLTVSGTTTFIDTANMSIEDPIIELARGNASDTIDAGLVITRATSNVAVAYRGDEEELALGYTQSGASGTDVIPVADGGLDVRVYGNLFANNLTTTANVEATYLKGDGSEITHVTLDQVVGYGNVTSNTIQLAGLTATGNVEANYFIGNGSKLTGLVTDLQSVTDNGNTSSNTIQFTNATTAFVADSNVGIGTDTPAANLHVMGYQYVNGPPTLANAFDHSDAPLTLTHDTATSSTAINDPKPLLHLTRSGTNNESYGARASFNLSRYENSSTHSRSRLDVALADGTYAESTVMTLRADGKVGVGTDTPAYTLDVAGDINLSGDFYQGGSPFVSSLWTDGTDSLYYRSNVEVGTANLFVDTTTSNVGIGTSTPAYTLDVAGDINLSGDFYQGGSPFVSSLWTENVGKLYYNGGNVGIGTTSPGYKLDVHGSANVGALTVTSVTGLEAADIPNLDASKITTGTLNNARLPASINVTNVSGNGSGLTSLNADNISSGTLNNARLPTSINVTNVSGNGSGLTSLNADNISSGTLNNARLTDASTTAKGIVQLSSSTGGASTTKAATESAVKAAYDRNSWGSGSFSSDVNITGGSFRVGNSNGTSQPQFFVKNEVNATDTDENDRALLQLKAGDSDHNGFLMDLDDDDTYSANGNNEFVFKIRTKDNAIADAADADTKFVIRPSGRILVNYGSTYKLTNPSDPYLAVNGDISSSGTITATSSVGIGTTSPGYTLDVHGSANVGALTATTISGPFSGNASTATALQTARNINGVSFDGSGNITVNGLNYDVNGVWLREQGDNTNFKQYGNSRQMVFRTDGTTQYASGVGAYPFVWMYGGDAASNRRMFLNTSGQLWCSNYGWLHDKFMARTQVFTDNVANTTFSGQTIDHNCSGSDACTTDRVHRALFIDMDSSATGGDTNHEHRMYGIYSDVRHSGDSDLVYGMYSYTRSDHASGTNTNLRAGDFTAIASGTGINTNIYGLNSYAIKDGGSTGTTANMYGVRGEVEVDAGTCTNAYAFQSHIDRDGGTITTGYLYYGSYSGTVGTKYGVYVTGETKNYFSGKVGIGTNNPGYKLEVNGTSKFTSEMRWSLGVTSHAGHSTNKDWYIRSGVTTGKVILQDTGGNVGVGTSNPTAKLHVNGYIKNGNPVFHAYRNSAWTTGGYATIPFNIQVHDSTNSYNTNGTFTAPVAGYYFFSVFALTNGNINIHLEFHKNGALTNGAEPFTGALGSHACVSGSIVIYLNVNDYVEVVMVSGAMYGVGNHHNGFCGYLIG